uniref:Mannosylglycerate hydrolase MGH1-like glycoside hydrolase domain-containing protein n=1 Tax=uncultured Thiotrichaceae bacterium TaxID=298394 RepID=A0A6S6U383_9GAMM|nr:MAG: FIG00741850: hypothetical protein [uncultured Thiotrichaceae bacterium]
MNAVMTVNSVNVMDQTAREILKDNDKGTYTVPTHGLYPYQWNWDSAFAAWGFAEFDIDRAWVELETLFAGQWDNGMVPHIQFHQLDSGYFPGPDVWQGTGPVPSSGISQPPIAATMAKLVYDKDPEEGKRRLEPLYEKMVAWHQWFMDWRLDQDAVCITHPWEAGRDNAPDWDIAMAAIEPGDVGEYVRRDTLHVDSAMRPTKYDYDRYIWLVKRGVSHNWDDAAMLENTPFRVADPTMTFTFLRAQRDLVKLGQLLERDVSAIEADIKRLEIGAESLWNEELGSYDSRDVKSGKWSGCISNASFLCWYAGLEAPQMRNLLTEVMASVKYGVPSLDIRNPSFDGMRYWRGPVWAIINTLIGIGMKEMDMQQESEDLRQVTTDLITEHGFSEYFDPRDGTPAGGQSFTWTAAIWLGWASPSAGAN